MLDLRKMFFPNLSPSLLGHKKYRQTGRQTQTRPISGKKEKRKWKQTALTTFSLSVCLSVCQIPTIIYHHLIIQFWVQINRSHDIATRSKKGKKTQLRRKGNRFFSLAVFLLDFSTFQTRQDGVRSTVLYLRSKSWTENYWSYVTGMDMPSLKTRVHIFRTIQEHFTTVHTTET